MSEVNENVQNETQETANAENQQIEIQKPGFLKKALKWGAYGLGVIASFLGGLAFGKSLDKDNENDSADAEAPTEE